MLPGVEFARRRRLRQGGGSADLLAGPRRSSIGFYGSTLAAKQRSGFCPAPLPLGDVAQEARERLDERLRTQWPSTAKKRHKSSSHIASNDSDTGSMDASPTAVLGNAQREVYCAKSILKRRLGWMRSRIGRKMWEQDDCAVCLDVFKGGDVLLNLPCAHRFHSSCVVPWLESSPYCPCCRTSIFS